MKNYLSVRLISLALAASALASVAAAKEPRPERPFHGRVEAVWDNVFLALTAQPARFVGISQVTHLGRAAQAGTLTLGPPTAPNIFPGSGSVTITAANGETLKFDYTGELNAATGEGKGKFTFTGGTGRFADATGTGTFSALINLALPANQPMTVRLDGRISY